MATETERTPHAQARHDRMLLLQANKFRAEGYAVAAALDGWPAPGAIDGQVPDVIAERNGETVVIEVETEDTLASKEYLAEHKTFRKWKEQSPKSRDYKMVIA